MGLHNVTESDNFDTVVQMPEDGDSADASDMEASTIRPLTNRSRWLKGKIDSLIAWITGGTVSPAGAVVVDNHLATTGNLAAGGDADIAAVLTAGALKGQRRWRFQNVTSSQSVSFGDAVDVTRINRPSLASGTTTITLTDSSSFKNGDIQLFSIVGASGGKNVSLAVPGSGTNGFGDTIKYLVVAMKISTNNWDIFWMTSN